LKRALRLPVAILVILLSGIAGVVLFHAAAHERSRSVVLKWKPPAPKSGVTVTGYRVYRSRLDGTFEPLAFVTDSTYVDNKVRRGASYRYYVTAVGDGGRESQPSAPASAVIR
jgi:fibronectin type 3 domain-containing protein